MSPELEFFTLVGKLKRTKRAGWVYKGVREPESVSDHMYRMAIMAMLVPASAKLNSERMVKLALVHDMAEAIVGDITPRDNVPQQEKHRRELAVIVEIRDRILKGHPAGQEIFDLWTEYEAAETGEAKHVKDIDKFELEVQAYEYEREQNMDLSEFFNTVKGKFRTPLVGSWDRSLRDTRADTESGPSTTNEPVTPPHPPPTNSESSILR